MAEKIRLNTRTDNKNKHLKTEDREDIQTGEILTKAKVLKQDLKIKVPVKVHLTWSAKRAAKDRGDRERMMERLNKKLEHPYQLKASVKRGANQFPEIVFSQAFFPKIIMRILMFHHWDFPEKEYDLNAILEFHQTGSDKEFEISVQKRTLEITPC